MDKIFFNINIFNMDNNNKLTEVKKMKDLKLQKGSIKMSVDINHYGDYSSDYDFGEYYKPYRDWVEKEYNIKWDDYTPGMFDHDTEMLQNFCDQNNYSIDCHYDEDTDNIYLIKIESKNE